MNVTPTSLTFGNVQMGQTADRTLTIQNVGTAALSITGLGFGNPALRGTSTPFSLVLPPATPFSIPAGGEQELTVRFAPGSPDAFSDTLIINSNDPDETPTNVSINGNGGPQAGPDINVTPSSLAFGNVQVNQTKNLSLTIQNTGNAALSITGLTGLAAPFSLVSPPATPFSIPAGGEQVLTVRFAPGSNVPTFTDALIINSNDPDETPTNVPIFGGSCRTPPERDREPAISGEEERPTQGLVFPSNASEPPRARGGICGGLPNQK